MKNPQFPVECDYMELSPKAQAVELIRQSQNVLILTHQDPDGDAMGSLLALRTVLQRLGKKVDAVFSGGGVVHVDQVGNLKLQAKRNHTEAADSTPVPVWKIQILLFAVCELFIYTFSII